MRCFSVTSLSLSLRHLMRCFSVTSLSASSHKVLCVSLSRLSLFLLRLMKCCVFLCHVSLCFSASSHEVLCVSLSVSVASPHAGVSVSPFVICFSADGTAVEDI